MLVKDLPYKRYEIETYKKAFEELSDAASLATTSAAVNRLCALRKSAMHPGISIFDLIFTARFI